MKITRAECLHKLVTHESYREASAKHQKNIKKSYEKADNETLELIYFAALKESVEVVDKK